MNCPYGVGGWGEEDRQKIQHVGLPILRVKENGGCYENMGGRANRRRLQGRPEEGASKRVRGANVLRKGTR